MHHNHRTETDRARLALELTMRDALDGMAELASMDAWWFDAGVLEILGIEPASVQAVRAIPAGMPDTHANILTFPEKRRCTG